MNYQKKYLLYKKKYIQLKNTYGGVFRTPKHTIVQDSVETPITKIISGIEEGLRVVNNFDTNLNLWTAKTINPKTKEEQFYTSQFIFNASGYYNYDTGYTPEFKGLEDFKGKFIHPQKWDINLDYKNKKVVVIGSGATAVTIVPKIADEVTKVIMLQRSPTYIAALPNKDKVAKFVKRILPRKIAHTTVRAKNILADMLFYNLCRKFPKTMKNVV